MYHLILLAIVSTAVAIPTSRDGCPEVKCAVGLPTKCHDMPWPLPDPLPNDFCADAPYCVALDATCEEATIEATAATTSTGASTCQDGEVFCDAAVPAVCKPIVPGCHQAPI